MVVRWCLLRSASRAKTFVHPSILHGHEPVSGFFFTLLEEAEDVFFFVSFFSSDYKEASQGDKY